MSTPEKHGVQAWHCDEPAVVIKEGPLVPYHAPEPRVPD